MDLSDMLTKPEAATYGKISESTISAWLTQGLLSRYKMGSRTLVSKQEMDALLKKA